MICSSPPCPLPLSTRDWLKATFNLYAILVNMLTISGTFDVSPLPSYRLCNAALTPDIASYCQAILSGSPTQRRRGKAVSRERGTFRSERTSLPNPHIEGKRGQSTARHPPMARVCHAGLKMVWPGTLGSMGMLGNPHRRRGAGRDKVRNPNSLHKTGDPVAASAPAARAAPLHA